MGLQKRDTVFFCKDYQLAKTKNSCTVTFKSTNHQERFGFILCFVQVQERQYADSCYGRTSETFSLDEQMKESITVPYLRTYLDKCFCPHVVKVVSQTRKLLIPCESLKQNCVYIEVSLTLAFISNPQILLSTVKRKITGSSSC